MRNFLEYINELKLHKLTDYVEFYFILHKGNLYTFDGENIKDVLKLLNIPKDADIEDIYELFHYINENHPYIIKGELRDNKIYLDTDLNYKLSGISKDMKKLKDFLKADDVIINHMHGIYLDGDENLKLEIDDLKDTYFYHGTCLEYLNNILRFGIKPMSGITNFKNIHHSDKIFLTTDKSKAIFHADKCAKNVNSIPVILKINIPDLDKLFPDFDLVISFYGKDSKYAKELDYHNIDVGKYVDKSMKFLSEEDYLIDLSKRFGLYAYKGRIPSKFIETIYTLPELVPYPDYYTEDESVQMPSWNSFEEFYIDDFLEEYGEYM